jgi:hypothetical protein
LALEVRYEDVKLRRANKTRLREEREAAIKADEERTTKRNAAVEE